MTVSGYNTLMMIVRSAGYYVVMTTQLESIDNQPI